MSTRLFALVAIAGVAVAGFFLARSLDDDLVYYLYVSEAVAVKEDFADGRDFRLAGIVEPGSLADLGGGVSEFVVGDGAASTPVRLTRTPPPLFDEDVPVVLVGSWEGDVFVATDALIRHEESYEAPDEGNFDEGGLEQAAASG
jgi:cytochrome c-type biogenesis protein CcmE